MATAYVNEHSGLYIVSDVQVRENCGGGGWGEYTWKEGKASVDGVHPIYILKDHGVGLKEENYAKRSVTDPAPNCPL